MRQKAIRRTPCTHLHLQEGYKNAWLWQCLRAREKLGLSQFRPTTFKQREYIMTHKQVLAKTSRRKKKKTRGHKMHHLNTSYTETFPASANSSATPYPRQTRLILKFNRHTLLLKARQFWPFSHFRKALQLLHFSQANERGRGNCLTNECISLAGCLHFQLPV